MDTSNRLIDLEVLWATLKPIYGVRRVAEWKTGKSVVHLALMQGDFLAAIIDGSKVIESRLTKARIAPVGCLVRGDLVLFKQVGKSFSAVGIVDKARSGSLDTNVWNFFYAHAEELGVDEDYLNSKADSRYYALAWMSEVHQIPYIEITKRDRRSWVLLNDRLIISAD